MGTRPEGTHGYGSLNNLGPMCGSLNNDTYSQLHHSASPVGGKTHPLVLCTSAGWHDAQVGKCRWLEVRLVPLAIPSQTVAQCCEIRLV